MMQGAVLVVDDEENTRRAIGSIIEHRGFKAELADSGEAAIRMMNSKYYPVIVTDLRMPGISGFDILEYINKEKISSEVIIATAYPTIDTELEAFRGGASDFVTKPLGTDNFYEILCKAFERNKSKQHIGDVRGAGMAGRSPGEIIGSSASMREVLRIVGNVAKSDANVLITGESGTGKELIAEAIHLNSGRTDGVFVPVNCVSLSEGLLESELFGHEKGAFTSAFSKTAGYFEAADKGTLFLDEIGEFPMHLQAKLLRAVQEKTFQRVGSSSNIEVDVRIICATNRDLEHMTESGEFREDLYYRLNVIQIELPPLRDRKEDIPLIASFLLAKYAPKTETPPIGFSEQAQKALLQYDWPGNIRELENVVQRALAFSSSELMGIECLPEYISDLIGSAAGDCFPVCSVSPFKTARRNAIEHFEKDYLANYMRRFEGNVSKTAECIGMGRTVLQRLLKKHGIQRRSFKHNS